MSTERILGKGFSSRELWELLPKEWAKPEAARAPGQHSQEGFLGYPVQGQGLDWVLLVDPFQLRIFWDCVMTNAIMQRSERVAALETQRSGTPQTCLWEVPCWRCSSQNHWKRKQEQQGAGKTGAGPDLCAGSEDGTSLDPAFPAPASLDPTFPAPASLDPAFPAPASLDPAFPAPASLDPAFAAPTFPAPSFPAPSFPAPSFPDPSFPAPSFPAPSFPDPAFPAPGLPRPPRERWKIPKPAPGKSVRQRYVPVSV
uniref:Uncharacterized protein n=1 Tax=Taeniopygia guttata TaxID=59729 RepID=A0A674HCJ0_TAEGU